MWSTLSSRASRRLDAPPVGLSRRRITPPRREDSAWLFPEPGRPRESLLTSVRRLDYILSPYWTNVIGWGYSMREINRHNVQEVCRFPSQRINRQLTADRVRDRHSVRHDGLAGWIQAVVTGRSAQPERIAVASQRV